LTLASAAQSRRDVNVHRNDCRSSKASVTGGATQALAAPRLQASFCPMPTPT
jgi:hypothetical protein